MRHQTDAFHRLCHPGGRCRLWLDAKPPPDAGALLQQIERDKLPTLPRQQTPLQPAPEPLKSLDGVNVTVSAFHFAGNRLLTEQQLAPVVSAYLVRPVMVWV